MQFGGKINEVDLNDIEKMSRSRTYWLKVVLANWYATALLIIVLWGTISGLIGQTKPNWQGLAIVWAILIALFLWAFYRAKRRRTQQLTQLNATLPDEVNLTSDGIKWSGPNGATGSMPWSNFKAWREGRRVMLIDQTQGNRVVILPIATLSDIDRIPIRQFLQSHIQPVNE